MEHTQEEVTQKGINTGIYRFFDRIAFLMLDNTRKEAVAEKVANESYVDKLYRIQLVLSCAIATLWLLINSAPVVIWAMLISPILRPIQSFAFAITNGNKHMYIRSLNVLVVTMLVWVVVAYLITFAVPFVQITEEIASRTSPTIVDLFIALASGLVAIISLGFNRFSEAFAGVAMAVALLPPLCVIWIWLQLMDLSIASGSTLLFMTNLIAIIAVAVFVFYLFGFFPTNKAGQTLSFSRILLVLITVVLVSFPLVKSMESLVVDYTQTQKIQTISQEYLAEIDPKIRILDVRKTDTIDGLRITLELQVPQWIVVTDQERNMLTKLLFSQLQRWVELDMRIVYVAWVYIEPINDSVEVVETRETQIEQELRTQFDILFPQDILESVYVSLSWEIVTITLRFETIQERDYISTRLAGRQKALSIYWWVPVVLDAKTAYVWQRIFSD